MYLAKGKHSHRARITSKSLFVSLISWGLMAPAFCLNNSPTNINGITLGSPLTTFKSQVLKAHIGEPKRLNGSSNVEQSYKTNGLNIGAIRWNPEFEFANDKGVFRLVCIVGLLPSGTNSAVLKQLTMMYGRPRSDQEGSYWKLTKNVSIALTKTSKSQCELQFSEDNLWNEYVRGASPPPNWFQRLEDAKEASMNAVVSEPTKRSGSSSSFEALMTKMGYKYKTTINEFAMYEKARDTVTMRSVGGNCAEGSVIMPFSKGCKEDDIYKHLFLVYMSLEKTLELLNRDSVDMSNSSLASKHASELLSQILDNLAHANRTEFAFDHLNVRGECYPVSQKELRAGQGPVIILKLWIP